jgi:hypothetical protein
VLRGAGGGRSAERELVVTEREWREEGIRAREDVTGAQENVTESNNVGTLGRAEEQDRRNAPGRMKNEIIHQGESPFTPLVAIEA